MYLAARGRQVIMLGAGPRRLSIGPQKVIVLGAELVLVAGVLIVLMRTKLAGPALGKCLLRIY